MKRYIAIFLCLLLILVLAAPAVFADDELPYIAGNIDLSSSEYYHSSTDFGTYTVDSRRVNNPVSRYRSNLQDYSFTSYSSLYESPFTVNVSNSRYYQADISHVSNALLSVPNVANWYYFDLSKWTSEGDVISVSCTFPFSIFSSSAFTRFSYTVSYYYHLSSYSSSFPSSAHFSQKYSGSSGTFSTVTSQSLDITQVFSEFDDELYDGVFVYLTVTAYTSFSGQFIIFQQDYVQFDVTHGYITAAIPTFSQNLASNPVTYVKGGSSSSLYVQGSTNDGGILSYQWYRSVDGSTDLSAPIPGATGQSYAPPTSDVGTFYYFCRVTNTLEDDTSYVDSNVKQVTIINQPLPPVISSNVSTGPFEYVQGDVASSLTVSATSQDGGLIYYQWYRNTVNSLDGAIVLSGSAGSSYIPTTASVGTYYYFCKVTNNVSGWSSSVYSNICEVVVSPKASPPSVTSAYPGTLEYELDDTASSLSVYASTDDGGMLSFQWYVSTSNTYGGTPLLDAVGNSYIPDISTVGTLYYYCVVTNTLNGTLSTSSSSIVSVSVVSIKPAQEPVIMEDLPAGPLEYYQGMEASPLIIGAIAPDGGTLTYQWYVNDKLMQEGSSSTYTPDTGTLGSFTYKVYVTNTRKGDSASVVSAECVINIVPDPIYDKVDESNNWLSGIFDAIANLPQAVLDGIKGLFVPDAEAMAAYKDQWEELLALRFGAVYESGQLISDFASSLQVSDKKGTITFPKVDVDLAGVPFSFGGWEVQVIPDGFEILVEALKKIISIIATLAFLNAMRYKFEGILGGGST